MERRILTPSLRGRLTGSEPVGILIGSTLFGPVEEGSKRLADGQGMGSGSRLRDRKGLESGPCLFDGRGERAVVPSVPHGSLTIWLLA